MFPFQAIHNQTCRIAWCRWMSKSYYQCFLFKQFTTGLNLLPTALRCQRAIINVSFSSNSQPTWCCPMTNLDVKELLSMFPFQAIHNILRSLLNAQFDVKELLSMFPFQAIHNRGQFEEKIQTDVKELLSMFPFQAIHNEAASSLCGGFDVKELLSMISDCKSTNNNLTHQIFCNNR